MYLSNIPICFTVALVASSYQIYRCLKYLTNSIRLSHSYHDKIEQGCMKLWEYIFMLVPIRYRDYYATPGLQGGNFYLTPLVGFFALSGNLSGWIGVFICVWLSTGGKIFKWLSPFMVRLPFYWGYFASLIIVMLAVEGLSKFNLGNTQLILLCIILGILLLFNSSHLPLYPEGMYPKKPNEWF